MKLKSETNRSDAGGLEVGEVSEEMVVERARQLARGDGRDDVGASDLEEAREQLMGSSEEIEAGPEGALAEDERVGDGSPPTENGRRIVTSNLDDEATVAEEEVEEGMAEADLDSREKSHRRE